MTSRLAIMTMGLTDAIVVGRYSAEQLGFHALGWAPTVVVLMVAIGLLSGIQVMTARVIGEGRRYLAGAVLRRGLTYALWIGLASTVVLVAAGPAFLHAIGLEPKLAAGASAALLVFALGMTFHTVSVAQTFWLEALNKASPVMWMMWVANIANLALNLLLVPGTFGLPALGAVGGAWATFGARAALTLGLTIYILRLPEVRALGLFDKPARDKPMEVEQRRVGYGAAFSNFSEVAAFAGMNVVAGWIGALEVAAYAIVLNVAAVIFMVPLGVSTATSVLVGNAYGARDPQGVRRAGAVAFVVTAVFAVVVSLVLWPTAEGVSRIYTDDARALALAVPALILAIFFLIPDALQVVVAHALRARGDVLMPSVTHMISYLAVMMPLSWWLAIPMGYGLNGIIGGIVVASFISAGLLLWRWWVLARRY
ncbi:MAG TPA: MATE family efflux transporter [Caulobacteraceae bacterium]|nr:MATE family efflux transporter [Caulobacteraceae bacterium]